MTTLIDLYYLCYLSYMSRAHTRAHMGGVRKKVLKVALLL